MINLSVTEAAQILGLPQRSSNASFTGISTDSRSLSGNNLFVAIAGEHFDGHLFIEEAQKKGATALLVSRPVKSPLPQLLVEDVVSALGKLTAQWRKQFNIPFIGITGSNGKTTLKNMLASILTAACHGDSNQVLATRGNLNNQLGLPLTLARLGHEHRYGVTEMGMNHFGEIAYLCQLTSLQVAVITNAAASHLAGVGNVQGVARAKAEIFQGLSNDGIAILNRNDDFYDYWRKQVKEHLSFGFHKEANVRPSDNKFEKGQAVTFTTPKGNIDIKLALLGRHNIHNALAATAATLALDIPLFAIKTGLENTQAEPGRLQLHQLANGVTIIDDTYNANPFSLNAAISTLASFDGKRVLVLGDMKELGSDEKLLHQDAGKLIRQSGIESLLTYGNLSADTALAFGQGAQHFQEQEKLLDTLKSFLSSKTTILIKGSRSMKMEKLVRRLIQ